MAELDKESATVLAIIKGLLSVALPRSSRATDNTVDGKVSVSLYAKDGLVWMNQNQLAELFATSKQNIGQHIENILEDKELNRDSVVKNYFTTAADGKDYNVTYYALDMILAIGFRVRSKRGTRFRIWVNQNLKTYMLKGFVMDDECLKNPDGRPDYFDELLERTFASRIFLSPRTI